MEKHEFSWGMIKKMVNFLCCNDGSLVEVTMAAMALKRGLSLLSTKLQNLWVEAALWCTQGRQLSLSERENYPAEISHMHIQYDIYLHIVMKCYSWNINIYIYIQYIHNIYILVRRFQNRISDIVTKYGIQPELLRMGGNSWTNLGYNSMT